LVQMKLNVYKTRWISEKSITKEELMGDHPSPKFHFFIKKLPVVIYSITHFHLSFTYEYD